jgi:hypothetical protein
MDASPGSVFHHEEALLTKQQRLDELWADVERTNTDLSSLQKNLKKHKRSIDRVWRDMSQEISNLVASFEARILHHRQTTNDASGGGGEVDEDDVFDGEEEQHIRSSPRPKKAKRQPAKFQAK